MGKHETGEEDFGIDTSTDAQVPRESEKTFVIDRKAEKSPSYKEAGRQRREAFSKACADGVSNLKEKLGNATAWLRKKAGGALTGVKDMATGALDTALAAPEMVSDAGKAVGRAGLAAEDAVWRGVDAINDAGDAMYNAGVAGVKKGKDAALVAGALGAGLAVGAGVAAVEGARAGGRFVGEKAKDAKVWASQETNRVVNKVDMKLQNLKYSAEQARDKASARVDRAVGKFDAWRNERRANELAKKLAREAEEKKQKVDQAAELLGMSPENLQKLIAFANSL